MNTTNLNGKQRSEKNFLRALCVICVKSSAIHLPRQTVVNLMHPWINKSINTRKSIKQKVKIRINLEIIRKHDVEILLRLFCFIKISVHSQK